MQDEQSEQIGSLLYFVAYIVGGIMALGALFAAVNMMYTAVSNRSVEIATLRALGFGAAPVVASILIEALVLALIGAISGAAIAWVLFNGNTFNFGGGLGQTALHLQVGAPLFLTGIVWACAIGFLGALFPAIKAARIPVAEGLRVIA